MTKNPTYPGSQLSEIILIKWHQGKQSQLADVLNEYLTSDFLLREFPGLSLNGIILYYGLKP